MPTSKARSNAPVKLTRRQLERDLAAAANPERAVGMARFFATGEGQYGAGDEFLGISVPQARKLAMEYRDLPLAEVEKLLDSTKHEHRFCALEILVWKFEHGGEALQKEVVRFYLSHTSRINNWDLVDATAPYIVGEYVRTRTRRILYKLARSKSLWERRIAVVASLALIKHGEIDDTFQIVEQLLPNKHDLIQKASGWALRETGKVSRSALLAFLEQHYSSMPRTTLRYAIEHLPLEQREAILKGNFKQ